MDCRCKVERMKGCCGKEQKAEGIEEYREEYGSREWRGGGEGDHFHKTPFDFFFVCSFFQSLLGGLPYGLTEGDIITIFSQ